MSEILLLGIIVSIIFYELTDISPGGIIVPGLMVVYITQPMRIIYTLVVAVVAQLLVSLLSKKIIIFGKRRFVLHIIVSFLLHLVINLIFGLFAKDFTVVALSLVGYTVSGIIANNIHKQGAIKTVASTVIVTGFLELLILLLSLVGVVL